MPSLSTNRKAVAQIFNLLYRRFSTCNAIAGSHRRDSGGRAADCKSAIRQSATLRYAGFGCVTLLLLLASALTSAAQPFIPHAGYVYPAGGRLGSTFQIVVGGQYLAGVSNAYITGDGVEARVMEYNRPLNQKEFTDLRDELRILQDKRAANRRSPSPTNTWTSADETRVAEITRKILKNPPNRQGNPAIAEAVTVQVTLSANAGPGERELRLAAPNGLSNPLIFSVGQLPEFTKPAAKATGPELERFLERLGRKPAPTNAVSESRIALPAMVNGQIMPGAVDRYRFAARQGEHLVAAVSARALIPYLPDAVPGWFQATLALYDAAGKELAYADNFRFHPDPVLHYEIPRDAEYVIEIKDSIYRGREDFVYRLAVGELPFVTGIFPLGGPAGTPTSVALTGWNLPVAALTWEDKDKPPGLYSISASKDGRVANRVPFAVDDLPECLEQEPNSPPAAAQAITLPVIVNGRIDQPGDRDVFRFEGRAGEALVAEVCARRLDSPVDSTLKLTDAAGRQLAFNDDHEDKASGLNTHHADSYLTATLPADGTYYLHLGDAQNQGGAEFAYRLRLSGPRPDFALRVVPSSLSARGGASVPVTVYALRKDGFTNAITLELKSAPEGFALSGARVPANQDQVRFTLTAPPALPGGPDRRPALQTPASPGRIATCTLSLEGWAILDDRAVFRPAVPAEDMMQAFAYRHLVPARELTVAVTGRGMPRVRILDPTPVKLPAGGTVRVRLGAPTSGFSDRFKLELSEPPEGISIRKVSAIPEGAEIELEADAAKTKPGLKGNLIVNAFAERPAAEAARGPANNRRPLAGTLPAIPFEVVAE